MRVSSSARCFALLGRSKTLLGLADPDENLIEAFDEIGHGGKYTERGLEA